MKNTVIKEKRISLGYGIFLRAKTLRESNFKKKDVKSTRYEKLKHTKI